MTRPLTWPQRRYRMALRTRQAAGYGLAVVAILLGGMIWVTWHVLEPLCVWCASWEPEPKE